MPIDRTLFNLWIDDDGSNTIGTPITKTRIATDLLNPIDTAIGGSVGKVIQIVAANYSTQVNSSSSTYADTGLTATITPTSSSNKVMVLLAQSGLGKDTSNTSVNLKLQRNGTDLVSMLAQGYTGTTTQFLGFGVPMNILDAPATTSALTYKTVFASNGGTANAFVQVNNSVSSIILMEVTP